MKKNLLILRRNIVSTIFEILFPIVLIVVCYAIRQAFTLKTFLFDEEEKEMENYIQNKSVIYKGNSHGMNILYFDRPEIDTNGLSIIPVLKICSMMNSKYKPRPIIASIGVPSQIKSKIEDVITDFNNFPSYISPEFEILKLNTYWKEFESVDKLDEYIKDKKYGQEGYPEICFGISYKKEGNKYDYALHYFDSFFQQGVKDVPNAMNGLIDQFSSGPDLESYKLYQSSGYTYIMKLINEHILNENPDGTYNSPFTNINLGMVAMPYEDYRLDPFSSVIGYFIPFFIVIAYMCPLCLYVYRMVGEKENKSKEGMKIMGLGEGTYFLSYFIQYIIISLIDSIVNTIFLSLLFTKIPFYYLFIVLFLWTLDVFALIFFFHSFLLFIYSFIFMDIRCFCFDFLFPIIYR